METEVLMRVIALVLVLLLRPLPALQPSPESLALQRKLDVTIEQYRVAADSFVQGLAKVATDFQIPMAVEWVRNFQTSRGIDQSWNHAKVSDIIKSLTEAYPGYEVRLSNGVMQILPVGAFTDEHDFLNTRVARFQAKKEWLALASSRLQFTVQSLIRPVAPLPPGAGEGSSTGVGVGGDRPVSVDFQNASVREILNGLIISASQTTWVVTYPESVPMTSTGLRRAADLFSKTVFADEDQPVWVFVPWGIPVRAPK
jgi:hypothetical protein